MVLKESVRMSTKSSTTRIVQKPQQLGVIVSGPKLEVMRTLQRADFGVFQDGWKALTHCPSPQVMLDLTRCTYVSSLFIGMLVDAVTSLRTAGKVVKVHVSPQVGRFLNMAHLYHLFEYTVVEPPEESHA